MDSTGSKPTNDAQAESSGESGEDDDNEVHNTDILVDLGALSEC